MTEVGLLRTFVLLWKWKRKGQENQENGCSWKPDVVGFYPHFMWRLGRGLPRTQVFFISQLMLQSCDNPTNMLTDFNLVVGFWFCENKYFHRRKVLPMKYRSLQDRATGRHRCWWVKHSSRQDFNQNCQNNQSSAFQSYSNRQVQLGQCFGGTSPQLPGGRIFSRLFQGAFSNSWPSPWNLGALEWASDQGHLCWLGTMAWQPHRVTRTNGRSAQNIKYLFKRWFSEQK